MASAMRQVVTPATCRIGVGVEDLGDVFFGQVSGRVRDAPRASRPLALLRQGGRDSR